MEAKRGGLVSTPFLDGMIMNYLIVHGYQAAAEMFELEVGNSSFFRLQCIYFEKFGKQIALVWFYLLLGGSTT